jgi:hypothetical protein
MANFKFKDEVPNGKHAETSTPEPEPEPEPIKASADAPQILALARKITAETEKLEAYAKANGIALPSFDVDSVDDFPKLPEDIQTSRQEILFATKELGDLVRGPREGLRWQIWGVSTICSGFPNMLDVTTN